jgi:hypothetical protein
VVEDSLVPGLRSALKAEADRLRVLTDMPFPRWSV